MRRTLLILFLLFTLVPALRAQTIYGVVMDGDLSLALSPVTIVNISTNASTVTDVMGGFSINAKDGDLLSFSFIGYHTIKRLAEPGKYLTVNMYPLSVTLKEYVLHPGYTPYQRDSAEMAETYSKEINTQKIKPGFSSANGGGFSGIIGSAVQKMSRSYKKNKEFKKNFQQDIEQKYIDTRYTPELVNSLTGFTGDTLAFFMNTYPMAYDFARSATDLEMKMWIRDNYKAYLKAGLKPPVFDSVK